MFPNDPVDNFITEYGFHADDDPYDWNTVVYFDGRYEMDFQVPVIINYKKNRIDHVEGIPVFLLMEIGTVSPPTPSGGIQATFGSGGRKFFQKDWEKIVAAHGDFSVIGVHLITNSPIPGFDNYVHGWRKDRVQVSP
jgi:hypothetical protein